MPVLLLFTNWHAMYEEYKKHNLGYWHCAALTRHMIVYSDEEMQNKDDWRYAFDFDTINNNQGIPAIGIYISSKDKQRDYSDLRPIYLIAYNFNLNERNDRWRYQFQVKTGPNVSLEDPGSWKNVELNFTSREFKEKLQKQGDLHKQLVKIGRAYFVFVEDNVWENVSNKLKIEPPSWWENARIRRKPIPEILLSQPQYRTNDGHFVRSRAEVIIDNVLYDLHYVHAYEYLLKHDLTCDFYLPQHDIYIEYWGMTTKRYIERKNQKREYYKNHGLSTKLLELEESDIMDTQKLKHKIKRFVEK